MKNKKDYLMSAPKSSRYILYRNVVSAGEQIPLKCPGRVTGYAENPCPGSMNWTGQLIEHSTPKKGVVECLKCGIKMTVLVRP
jgi:hypothetical protein